MEFLACPQSYLFQYLLKIRQEPNLALAKGSMCHTALEQVFDLKSNDRTLKNLHNLLRAAWREARQKEQYSKLFQKPTSEEEDEEEWDYDAERVWGKEAIKLLSNYYALEDPTRVPHPNPIKREIWLNQHLTTNPRQGATGTGAGNDASVSADNSDVHETETDKTFLVRGIVDRIDLVQVPSTTDDDNKQQLAMRIVDYKTGKAPDFKYSPAMNRKIANDSFFQLKIYALLLREIMARNDEGGNNGKKFDTRASLLQHLPSDDSDVRMLRLLHLTSKSDHGEARYLDMDLGEDRVARDAQLQEVHDTLARVWREIRELVDRQDARAFRHCDRPFCFCHKTRPSFARGTVWERTEDKGG